MLYGVGGMAVFFTFLTSMFCFEVSILHLSNNVYPYCLNGYINGCHWWSLIRMVSIAMQAPGQM